MSSICEETCGQDQPTLPFIFLYTNRGVIKLNLKWLCNHGSYKGGSNFSDVGLYDNPRMVTYYAHTVVITFGTKTFHHFFLGHVIVMCEYPIKLGLKKWTLFLEG